MCASDSPLDTNPNTNNGNRIFPGKQTPTDDTARNTVEVVATISPAQENITVYFKVFDVDDPSSDEDPVDSNGSDGNDNRGGTGTLSATSAVTDSNGEAKVTFTVGMNPGDNYRVAATLNPEEFDNLTVTSPSPKFLIYPDNNQIDGFIGKTTNMLTVWRKLNLEFDLMKTPTRAQNTWEGNWDDPIVESQTVWIDYYIYEDPAEDWTIMQDYWKGGGAFLFNNEGGNNVYAGVIGSEKNIISENRIKIAKNILNKRTSGLILLGDDDFRSSNDSPFHKIVPNAFRQSIRTNQGTSIQIQRPDIAAVTLIEEAYNEAFIHSHVHEKHTDYYEFDCWTESAYALGPINTTYLTVEDYDDKQDMARSPDFWACTIVVLFQPHGECDNDPSDEGLISGITAPFLNGDTAILFHESIK